MGYYADGLPRLDSYEEALAWFNSRVPYKRGRSKGLRPLGTNRRYDRSLISTLTDADGKVGSVILTYHTTPVITFYADNSILLEHGGFESVSTLDFINCILHSRLGRNVEKWAGVTKRRGKLYLSDGRGQDHRFKDKLLIDADNEITGTASESAWMLDKSVMGKLRKHYAEFTEYLTYYAQITGSRIASAIESQNRLSVTKTDLRWRWNSSSSERLHRDNFFNTLGLGMSVTGEDRLEYFRKLAEQLVVNAASKEYDYNRQEYAYYITPQRAKEFFYDLCRYHYATFLFKKEVVAAGKIVLDENSKYVLYKSTVSFLPFEI